MVNFILGFILGGFFGMFITIIIMMNREDETHNE